MLGVQKKGDGDEAQVGGSGGIGRFGGGTHAWANDGWEGAIEGIGLNSCKREGGAFDEVHGESDGRRFGGG
jgi:hypothetical protein